ncbi:hypothetical protein GC163_19705 [bacterium]|nr:hypothetical protein [bacterium]
MHHPAVSSATIFGTSPERCFDFDTSPQQLGNANCCGQFQEIAGHACGHTPEAAGNFRGLILSGIVFALWRAPYFDNATE